MKRLVAVIALLVLVTGCGCSSNGINYKQTLENEYDTEYTEENFFLALQFNNYEIVELFLKAGIDPDVEDMVGRRALFTAIQFESIESIELLFDYGADPDYINEWGINYIHFAVNNRYSCDTINALANNGVDTEFILESGSNALDSAYAGYNQHGTDYSIQINCLEALGVKRNK